MVELKGIQGAVRAGRIGGGPDGEGGNPREQGVVPASAVQRDAGRALRPDLAAVQGGLVVEGGVAVDHESQRGGGRVDGGGDGDCARVHGARAGVQGEPRGAGARVIDGAADRDAVIGLHDEVGRGQVTHDRGRQRGVDGHGKRIEQEGAAAADKGAGVDARAGDVRRIAAGKLDEAAVAAKGAGAGGEIAFGRDGLGGFRDETAAAGLAGDIRLGLGHDHDAAGEIDVAAAGRAGRRGEFAADPRRPAGRRKGDPAALRDQGGGFDQPVDVHDAGEGAGRGVGGDEDAAAFGADDARLLHAAAVTEGELEKAVAGQVEGGAGTARELHPAQAGRNQSRVDHAGADERGKTGVGDGDATGVDDFGAGGPGGEDELTGVKPRSIRFQRDGGEAARLDHAGSADEHAVRIGHDQGAVGLHISVQTRREPPRDTGEQQRG